MKVYNLENIKSATELKHRTEVISMNERSIIVLDTFTGIAQKLQAVSISLFHLDIEKVMNQLQDFENDCGNWLDNLLSSEMYNPQIQISAESETKRSIFRKRDKTKRSKKESAQHSKSRNKSFVMTSVSAL